MRLSLLDHQLGYSIQPGHDYKNTVIKMLAITQKSTTVLMMRYEPCIDEISRIQ